MARAVERRADQVGHARVEHQCAPAVLHVLHHRQQRTRLGDAFELDPATLPVPRFDLVLSDMMPNTIGHKASDHYRSMAIAERALWLCERLLITGGAFLVKVFQGADFEQYRNLMRERFRVVKIKKPKSSRPNSREMFMLGLDKKKEEIHAEEKTDWWP